MNEKSCSKCAVVKPQDAFAKAKKGKFGRLSVCRECVHRLYYESPEKRAAALARTRKRRSTPAGREAERRWQRARRRAFRPKRMLQEARTRAVAKGLDFDLKIEDIPMPETCPVLGIKIDFGARGRADGSPSIDRVDNTKGYVRGNVRVISWRANRLKSDATTGELRLLVAYCERERPSGAVALTAAPGVRQNALPPIAEAA